MPDEEAGEGAGGKEAAWAAADAARDRWGGAMRAHQQAPPDPGFPARLGELAAAAADQEAALRAAEGEGFQWSPVPDSRRSQPPYELRPESGRRGPEELWEAFDRAVRDLNEAGAGDDLQRVIAAYAAIAEVAGQLAEQVGQGEWAPS